jgi:hypothetical protein
MIGSKGFSLDGAYRPGGQVPKKNKEKWFKPMRQDLNWDISSRVTQSVKMKGERPNDLSKRITGGTGGIYC